MSEAGKVEFAPDYKSKRYPDTSQVFKQMERRTEHNRLKNVVVEAARADRAAENRTYGSNEQDIDAMIKSRTALRKAVDALIEFESREVGKSDTPS